MSKGFEGFAKGFEPFVTRASDRKPARRCSAPGCRQFEFGPTMAAKNGWAPYCGDHVPLREPLPPVAPSR